MRKKTFIKIVNPDVKIVVELYPSGVIISIDNPSGINFPFYVGQILQRNCERWADVNGFRIEVR